MNKISAIKINRKELNDLLKVLTDEGKLIGFYEENEDWEDAMAFVHGAEEYLNEDKTKELLASHFSVKEILYYFVNSDLDECDTFLIRELPVESSTKQNLD